MPEIISQNALLPIKKIGPLYTETRFRDLKDPCIAFDGTTWHIYGSGGDTRREEWEICHATAPTIEGPWTEGPPVMLRGVTGPHVAAPSVIYDPDDKLFHMAVQKDFMDIGEGIAYLVSADGEIFTKMRTLMNPKGEFEAGLYDPHLSVVQGKKYMAYCGTPDTLHKPNFPAGIPQPDIYLSRSMTDRWAGHWKRMKAIMRHEDIGWHHNEREHPDYEWGIEGPQIVELPDTGESGPNNILLNATCFIKEGRRGTRQRVFFALATEIGGPYVSLGPVLPAALDEYPEWENGENGHASAIVVEDKLYLFYQARSQKEPTSNENPWRYGLAVFSIADIFKSLPRSRAS